VTVEDRLALRVVDVDVGKGHQLVATEPDAEHRVRLEVAEEVHEEP
jgi:hypothetical protein